MNPRAYLRLRLDAPMMSFGAPSLSYGGDPDDIVSPPAGVPIGAAWIPRKPAIVGMLANALGYERYERDALTALSARVRMASAVEAERGEPQEMKDFQTAQLGADDRGWTTRGQYQGRRGGLNTYESSHLMRKTYLALCVGWVALRLEDGTGPTLNEIEAALLRPERPLFLGRKTCVPSGPVLHGRIEAADGRAALADLPGLWGMAWDPGEGPADAPLEWVDDKDFSADVYRGERPVHYDLPDPRWIGYV